MRRVVGRPSVDTYRRVCERAGRTGDNEALFKQIGDETKAGVRRNNDTNHMQILASCDRVVHYCLCGGTAVGSVAFTLSFDKAFLC